MNNSTSAHLLTVDPALSGYENLVGTCTKCESTLIVNRATDLAWAYPAANMTLSCFRCNELLRIAGDNASHPVDQLVYDADGSFFERRYVQCVITLSQAMELALLMCATAWILRPLHDIDAASTELRACESDLRDAVDRLTLEQLRRVLEHITDCELRDFILSKKDRVAQTANGVKTHASISLLGFDVPETRPNTVHACGHAQSRGTSHAPNRRLSNKWRPGVHLVCVEQ